MLNSIVGRNRLINPLSGTEKKIIRSATRLFLQNGFSGTTLKMISDDTGIRQGTICYHFHSKEDMLYMLIQELMDFHRSVINDIIDKTEDVLLSYATEITAQITLCERDKKAWDLYYSAYSLPGVYELIKDFSSKKNYSLYKERLPDWNENDFRVKENIASSIELSAFTSPCDRDFTLEDKITLILDSLMMLYEVAPEERKETINKILTLDYMNIGFNMFGEFVKRLDNDIEEEQ